MFADKLEDACPINFYSSEGFLKKMSQEASLAKLVDLQGFVVRPGAFIEVLGSTFDRQEIAIIDLTSSDRPKALLELGARLAKKLRFGAFSIPSKLSLKEQELFALGWGLSSYSFDFYLKGSKEKTIPELQFPDSQKCQDMMDSIFLARDLVNSPPNDMSPEHLELCILETAKIFGARVEVTKGDSLLDKNFPAIHAVGRASPNQPRLIEMNWGDNKHPKISIVGKGVCFDSGGYDLKPSSGMRKMKKDMGGAAIAIALSKLIMQRNLPIQLQLLIPAVENMVSGDAFKPGDIIDTRKGISVEIDNTDAEGRLVLCDALVKACENDSELVIDFATLTGACRVALGQDLPGLFSNDQDLAFALQKLSFEEADPMWSLPLHKAYMGMLSSDVADCSNSASGGFGGAITAALYLSKFIDDRKWIHMDVYAWSDDNKAHCPRGGEAMGLRSVFEFLSQRYS